MRDENDEIRKFHKKKGHKSETMKVLGICENERLILTIEVDQEDKKT
jgi:hypothetical protein